MNLHNIKERIKSYQNENCNHVEVKDFPNYQLFENGKLWSWSKLDWCRTAYKSDICYQLVNHKTGVRRNISINTLIKNHFGHILYPQDNNFEGIKHVSLDEDHELFQNGVVWSGTKQKNIIREKNKHYVVYINGKGLQVHRLLYEHFINPIPKGYIIHHLNNIGTDNNLNNLILIQQSQHKRLHDNLRKNIKNQKIF